MTLFEYLSVAVSIVVSLSAAQILASLRSILDPGRLYWVHTLWVFYILVAHVVLWWEFWAFSDVEDWTLLGFLLVLMVPGLLFVASHALATPDSDMNVDWETHFFSVRRFFLVPYAVLLLISFARDWLILDKPFDAAQHWPELSGLALFAAGVASDSRRVHAIIALALALTMIAGIVSLWDQPGGASRL